MPFESFVNDDFCRRLGKCFVEDLVGLLSKKFGFSQNLRNILAERYDKMRQNFLNVPYDDTRWEQKSGGNPVEGRRDALLKVNISKEGGILKDLKGYFNLGFDLPVWFAREGTPKKKIMIIAQDPLRKGHAQGELILSTPWGVHSNDYANHPAPVIKNKLEYLVKKHDCAVYITDGTKFYFTYKIDSKTPSLKKRREILNSNLQSEVLRQEIQLFDPDFIITLGHAVIECNPEWRVPLASWRNMVRNLDDGVIKNINPPVLPLYHSGHWKGQNFAPPLEWKEYFNKKLEYLETLMNNNDF